MKKLKNKIKATENIIIDFDSESIYNGQASIRFSNRDHLIIIKFLCKHWKPNNQGTVSIDDLFNCLKNRKKNIARDKIIRIMSKLRGKKSKDFSIDMHTIINSNNNGVFWIVLAESPFVEETPSVAEAPAVPSTPIQSDNKDYLDLLKQPLFLEPLDAEPVISLETVFVMPRVQDGSKSANDCILEWWKNSRLPVMLLYGEAGIGKTSLVAKLITDSPDGSVQAVALRNHCDYLAGLQNHDRIEKVICTLFGAENIAVLKDKLLILDGMDELTVLIAGFNVASFIHRMTSCSNNLHILITSRKGYFSINPDWDIQIETLCWKEEQVQEWCKKYGNKTTDSACKNWCEKFPEQYEKLPRNDKKDLRYQILCIPFILYLCCNSQIDTDTDKTVCRIYDKAFRTLLIRKHCKRQRGGGSLQETDADKRQRVILWQYTKELAYQMFLHDTLDLSGSCTELQNAQNRTIEILGDKDVKADELQPDKYLAVFTFAKKNGETGISFVHKTVYEYFTALKLYEDYFAGFSRDYFLKAVQNGKYDAAVRDVMDSFIKAFRYKEIPSEIFEYLCEFVKPPFSGEDQPEAPGREFDFENYAGAFVAGLKQHYLADFDVPKRIKEYLAPGYQNIILSGQISLAFSNFTWFLTGHGFSEKIYADAGLHDLCDSLYQKLNMQNWQLSQCNLCIADLRGADLRDADLRDADLSYADLRAADLRGATFENSTWAGARYSYCTNFPKGFDPKMHGMILVKED